MNNTDSYAYAVGRVKALEARMLDTGRAQRIIEAQDYEEAVRFLADSEYSTLTTGLGFETALEEEQRRTHLTVASFSPDPYFTGTFFAWDDFLYVKALLKDAFLKASNMAKERVINKHLGWMSPEALIEITDNAVAGLPMTEEETKFDPATAAAVLSPENYIGSSLRLAAYEAVKAFRATGDPLEVDRIVDNAFFRYAAYVAISRRAGWLQGFIAAKADMTNLLMIMRASNAGKDTGFLEKSLVFGGSIPIADLLISANEGAGAVEKLLTATNYWKYVSSGFESWKENGALRPFEMAAENMLASYARQSRQMTGGYEPVVGYLLSKDLEITMLRKILTGKARSMGAPFIRERLSNGNA